MTDVGLRIYSLSYTQELFKVKITEAFPILGVLISKWDHPLIEKFHREHGVFVAHVRDEVNLGTCRAAFLMGQGIELALHLQSTDSDENGPKLKLTPDPGHMIRVHSPKSVRRMAREIAEGEGREWEKIREYVEKIVDKFYQDGFVLVTVDQINAGALRCHFASEDDADLRVRFKTPEPVAAS